MLKYFTLGIICGLLLGSKLEITIALKTKKQTDINVGELKKEGNK